MHQPGRPINSRAIPWSQQFRIIVEREREREREKERGESDRDREREGRRERESTCGFALCMIPPHCGTDPVLIQVRSTPQFRVGQI